MKWIAKCRGCGNSKEQEEKSIKEWYCNECQEWVPFKEVSNEPAPDNGYR